MSEANPIDRRVRRQFDSEKASALLAEVIPVAAMEPKSEYDIWIKLQRVGAPRHWLDSMLEGLTEHGDVLMYWQRQISMGQVANRSWVYYRWSS